MVPFNVELSEGVKFYREILPIKVRIQLDAFLDALAYNPEPLEAEFLDEDPDGTRYLRIWIENHRVYYVIERDSENHIVVFVYLFVAGRLDIELD